MTDARKFLIIRLSSLGDIIHTLPAFQSLRSSFPDARIDWLVERRLAFLLTAVPGIDEIIPIDTHTMRRNAGDGNAWRNLWAPVRRVRARRYDVAIDFQGLIKTAVIARMSGAGTRIGFGAGLVRERPAHWLYRRTVENPSGPVHVARLNLLLARAAGADPAPEPLQGLLQSSGADIAAVETRLLREQLSDFLVINPGGGWPTKRWLPERYAELAARVAHELQWKVVVTTGPGEESLYARIAAVSGAATTHLHLPFLQLIPLFRKARVVVAGDTGPMHLACALETPVVAVMGPTAPVRNGPWSDRDEVVVRELPCSFCNGRSCPTANECMDIPVARVFDAIVRRVERNR